MSKNLSTFPKIIVILGPTASGKSELAVKIAKKFNAEIISADSRQVYEGLNIGSGKITKKEMRGIPHHLLDVASPKKTFTVAQYQKLAKKALQKILAKNKLPIICGGTGFYIDALVYDYRLPEVPPDKKMRKKFEGLELTELLKILKRIDPERFKTIDRKNKRRLIRAIEIAKTIGKTPKLKKHSSYNVLRIGIKKPAEELKRLITKRLSKRLNQGLIKEVKNLHKKGLSWQRLDDLGLEYRYVSRYLAGLINKKEMINLILKESWQYTKRQMTWFKKGKEIHWIKNQKEAENLIKKF
jgi:tRNA dimethylallyltransferase